MQTDRRPRCLLHLAGSKKMIEVGISMENMADGQSELVQLVENSLRRSTRIDHDCLLRHRISNDRAIATEGRDGKGFSNHGRHDRRMLPFKPIRAQAAALHSALLDPEWST